jgi:hypothetical protein
MTAVMILVAVGVYMYTRPTAKTNAQEQLTFPKGYTVGMWNWTAPDQATQIQKEQDAKKLKEQGITEVYIDISSYIDYDESTAPDRQAKIDSFTNALRQQVRALSAQGIKTQALVGNVKWSNPDYVYIPQKLMKYVSQYNASSASNEKLQGMQFDIEFYSADDFTDDPEQNTRDYLSMVKQLVIMKNINFANDANFALGFAAADWLDGTNAHYIPNISLDGGPKLTPFEQLAVQLKGVSGAYIAVMAYRNHTDGSDGTIARASSEVKIGQKAGVRILVGEEAGKVDPAKLTFYGRSKNDLKQSTIDVQKAFSSYSMFGGFGINDQKSYFALKD